MTRPSGERRFPGGVAVSVTLAAVGFFAIFGHLMVTAYRRFALNAFDLAIFDQEGPVTRHPRQDRVARIDQTIEIMEARY